MGSHQTGKKKANRLGLFDMSGNVSEWCYDLYNAKVSVETVTDPLGAMSGDYHVIRGGNWQSLASETSVCFRDDYAPLTDRRETLGLRLVRSGSKN